MKRLVTMVTTLLVCCLLLVCCFCCLMGNVAFAADVPATFEVRDSCKYSYHYDDPFVEDPEDPQAFRERMRAIKMMELYGVPTPTEDILFILKDDGKEFQPGFVFWRDGIIYNVTPDGLKLIFTLFHY